MRHQTLKSSSISQATHVRIADLFFFFFCKLWPEKHLWRATGGSPFECVDMFKLRMKHWMIKVFKQLGLKFSSKKMSPATSTYQFRCLPYLNKFAVKFPHSHILHYAFSSWIEKTITKKYISIRKTDLFYNSMRLCGNFTKFASIWRENVTHIHAGVKKTKIVIWRLHFSSYNSLKPF